MNKPTWREKILLQEDLNFLLTNRVPRIALTRFMGWFSRIQSPRLTRLSIAVWRLFTPLDLSDARQQRFDSLHACFTRELKPGARAFDQRRDVICSPSDAIVGACGVVDGTDILQAKGFPYPVRELLQSEALAHTMQGGRYVTLRLTSAMYHRFHAPHDLVVDRVTYLSGDTWNVNPIALKRVQKLFCKNERAVIETRLSAFGGAPLVLVPVAAILVASIRLHCLDVLLHLRWPGPSVMTCSAPHAKGQEMGWFEHGSTIIVFVPSGFDLVTGLAPGARLRAGEALFERDTSPPCNPAREPIARSAHFLSTVRQARNGAAPPTCS
ncbi:archaetidylserine decarboxylase [Hydrogenophaga defluvii]|uniref:phosphatidylserine decarboxylase n=1 Tax=Hydrogenophaga defluvii TaxID=249410 RepID=A0ABW2SF28_9BURK